MADRVVKVSLTAVVSNYVAGMEQARKATRETANESDNINAKLQAQSQALTMVGTGLMAMGAIAVASVGIAVKKFADFDEAMSFVAAATHESADNMNLLRDAALEAGARTVFSATESANAIEELGKAGLTTADILGGGLDGALSLAAAGGLGVAEAAGIAAIALKTFKLEGSDMTHVADLLAAGAGKAMGDVTDLAAALSQSGQVASATGLSIEETTATLSAFAAQGLLGSDAGTSFKSMLQRLTPQSDAARNTMEKLGISAYDASGEFIGMAKFAGVLQTALKDKSTEERNSAMATIFGSDAVRAATVLYSEGADGIAKWEASVNDSGYAAETAAMRLDNLKGDVEQLGGAFETALIKSGSGANDILRLLTQDLTTLIDIIGSLPTPVLNAGLGITALVGGVALVGGAALVAIPKIAEFKIAMQTLGISGGSVAGKIALTSGALALATVVFGLWISKQSAAAASTKGFEDSLDAATGATTDYTRELVAKRLEELKAFEVAGKAGITQEELTDAVIKGGDALADVQGRLEEYSDSQRVQGERAGFIASEEGKVAQKLRDVSGELDGAAKAHDNLSASEEKGIPTTAESTAAYQDAAAKVDELESNMRTLMDTIDKANGKGRDAITANIGYQQSLADVDAQIALIAAGTEGYAATLDITSQAGRDNKAMLVDLATANSDAALAQFELDGDTEKYKQTLIDGHQAVIDRATAIDGNTEAAGLLADEIAALPTETQLKIMVDQAQADAAIKETARQLEEFKVKWTNVPITMSLFLDTTKGDQSLAASAARYTAQALYYANLPAKANGGILPGPPSSKDNMFIHAASGEFVTNARSTADPANRRALEFMNNGGTIRGYANGGQVRPQYVTAGSGGGNSYSTTGDTYNPTFQVIAQPDRPLWDQVVEANRRLKIRR